MERWTTMEPHLTLAEEVTLLLYSGTVRADGQRTHDIFSQYGSNGSLVAGALMMDLALHGRARMEHPLPPSQRRRRPSWVAGLTIFVLIIVLIFGPLALALYWRPELLRTFGFAPLVLGSFVVFLLVIALGNLFADARVGKLVIVDTSPTGEAMADITLLGLARIGMRKRPKKYIRRYFGIRRLNKDLATLRAQLEARHCVEMAPDGKRSTFFGLVEVRWVDRTHPEFVRIGDRVRRLLLTGEVPDADAVALALLYSGERQAIVLGRLGSRALNGLYQFFTPAEAPEVKRRLRALVKGDPAISAQIGADLYDTLLAIRNDLEELREAASRGSMA
jgi:hypothetical protein